MSRAVSSSRLQGCNLPTTGFPTRQRVSLRVPTLASVRYRKSGHPSPELVEPTGQFWTPFLCHQIAWQWPKSFSRS
ncbi:hypothetical protein Plhal703r1_c40g0139081 [Plasmopara halstedii]